MNSTLKNRLKKLEASHPEKESSLTHLTDAELNTEINESAKVLGGYGIEPNRFIALNCIEVREFCKDDHWVRDANHRISVFQKFLGVAHKQNLPDKIKDVFGLGWCNASIPTDDIKLVREVLHDVDLGEETPWLKEYLENSGVVSEFHSNQYRSIDDRIEALEKNS